MERLFLLLFLKLLLVLEYSPQPDLGCFSNSTLIFSLYICTSHFSQFFLPWGMELGLLVLLLLISISIVASTNLWSDKFTGSSVWTLTSETRPWLLI